MSKVDKVRLQGTDYDVQDTKAHGMIARTENGTTSARDYAAGEFFIMDGALYKATADIEAGGAISADVNCERARIADEVARVQEAAAEHQKVLNNVEFPNVKDSENVSGVDLDIGDGAGNVLARFSGGHVRTKRFDSSDVLQSIGSLESGVDALEDALEAQGAGLDALEDAIEAQGDSLQDDIEELDARLTGLQSAAARISESENVSGVDLDIADGNGNVLARFSGGNVKTKNFDSADLEPHAVEDFTSEQATFTSGTQTTLSVNAAFKKGDLIYFHLDDGCAVHDFGKYATYYQGSVQIAADRRGSNGYFPHVITADCSQVSIVIAGSQYTTGQTLKLHAYRINGEVKPKIVTVKKDGTGMYTTIKEAVESITDANAVTNPYVIEVYPGVYDTLEGYTDEEIASADTGGSYTQTSFVGVKLTDGMSIRGMGTRDDVILSAELSTATWTNDVRKNISTLNIQGSGSIENMTILGKNIRYCVHDDFQNPTNTRGKRVLRNLKFGGSNLAYAPQFTTYGAGMATPRDYVIEHCDFGYDLGIHSQGSYQFGCVIRLDHCSGCRFRIGDYAANENDAVNQVIINDCDFQQIRINHDDDTISQHMLVSGSGCGQAITKGTADDLFLLGMIEKTSPGMTAGKLVKRKTGRMDMEATGDKQLAAGIVVGADSDYSYVQKTGFIAANKLGLTGLSLGDYVTVDANNEITATGATAANAVGVTAYVDEDGVGYIRMTL